METRGPSAGKSLPLQEAGDDKLRELRDRAHAALAEQRRHMQELEQRLVSQLEAVANELAEDVAHKTHDIESTGPQGEERNTLHRERVDWRAEQELAEAQMQSQLEDLRARDYELSQREQQLEVRWLEMTDQEEELAQQLAMVKAERDALHEERQSLATERDALDQASRQCEETRAACDNRQQELEARVQQLDERQGELARREEQLAHERQELDSRRAEAESLSESQAEREQQLAEQERELAQGRDSSLQQFEERRAAEQQAHEQQVAELRAQLAELQEQTSLGEAAATEWREKYEQEKSEWDSLREKFIEERDTLSTTLRRAEQQLEEVQAKEASDEEYEELDQKFQLALADVQTLRQQVAELEQQLALRPEQEGTESAELSALRDERDHLLERIGLLEEQSSAGEGPDQSPELSDLQRRFEMAVQDVRELRLENSKLKDQLDKQRNTGSAAPDDGALDWEAQKRRLLASLEGEDGDFDPDRDEERTTIEGTIRITDEVIGEKDRQIAELERQLREQTESAQLDDTLEAQHDALLDSDEIIQAERQKLATLQDQLNDALRKAELELSVERARIARERSRMEELQQELEQLRHQGGGDKVSGKGRGRWLSKLGLGGEEPLA